MSWLLSNLKLLTAIGSIITAFATVALAYIAWKQLSEIAKENRKWRTLETLQRYDSDTVMQETTARIWDASKGGQDYSNMITVKRDVINLLNFLDMIAIGIQQGFFVEEIVYDHFEVMVRKAVKEFLSESRAEQLELDRENFQFLIDLDEKWTKKEVAFREGTR